VSSQRRVSGTRSHDEVTISTGDADKRQRGRIDDTGDGRTRRRQRAGDKADAARERRGLRQMLQTTPAVVRRLSPQERLRLKQRVRARLRGRAPASTSD